MVALGDTANSGDTAAESLARARRHVEREGVRAECLDPVAGVARQREGEMRMHIHQAGHYVGASQVDLLDVRRGAAPARFFGAAVLDAAAAYPDAGRLCRTVGDAVDDGAVAHERV